MPGTLIGTEDTVQSWEKMCTVGSYVSVQAGSRTPLEYKRKRGVKDDSIVFVLSNCRDGLVIKYKVG